MNLKTSDLKIVGRFFYIWLANRQKVTMKTIILKNGLIGGGIVSAFMVYGTVSLMKNPTAFEPNYILGFGGMILSFVFIFIGVYQYRKENDGIIAFSKALTLGVLITLIISTIYVLVWLIEYYNFFPDFIEKYGQFQLEEAQKTITDATELAKKKEEIKQFGELYKNPVMVIMITYTEILPLGLLFTLLAAFIMRKNK